MRLTIIFKTGRVMQVDNDAHDTIEGWWQATLKTCGDHHLFLIGSNYIFNASEIEQITKVLDHA